MTRLVLVVLALAAVADAAPRAGRVVRIERGPKRTTGVPRWCEVNTTDLSGFCIGKQPTVGERITIVDPQRVLGVIAVTATTPYMATCNDAIVWQVQGRPELGDVASGAGVATGWIDVAIDARAGKLVTVDATRTPLGAGASVEDVQAIDADGDGAPDVEIVRYFCDDSGNPSSVQDARCVDVWVATSKRKFERIRQDRVRNC